MERYSDNGIVLPFHVNISSNILNSFSQKISLIQNLHQDIVHGLDSIKRKHPTLSHVYIMVASTVHLREPLPLGVSERRLLSMPQGALYSSFWHVNFLPSSKISPLSPSVCLLTVYTCRGTRVRFPQS